MSDQKKNASINSPVGSNQSDLGEDLSDVSASESELVGDDTKSLNFEKKHCWMWLNWIGWLLIGCWKGLLFDCLKVKQLLSLNLMNVLFLGSICCWSSHALSRLC